MSAVSQLTSIPEIAGMLARQAEAVASYLLPNGKKEGKWWSVGSVNGEAGNSLKVSLTGEKAGRWTDYANPDHHGDLVDLWTFSRGLTKSDALKEIRSYLNLDAARSAAVTVLQPKAAVSTPKPAEPAVAAKPISREYHQTLQANLAKDAEALAYLHGEKRGLTKKTLAHFGLGLSGAYKRPDGSVTSRALVAPMLHRETGQFLNKSAYICVPGVTQNPTDKNGWMKGEPQCYYAEPVARQRVLFICEGLKDVWRHWQALSEAGATGDILLVSSTHGSAIPAEWNSDEFWKPWSAVYLGQDNDDAGDKIAERVVECAGREVRRIKVPEGFGKDWTDFWQNGGHVDQFRELLDKAPVASAAVIQEKDDAQPNIIRIGRFSHKPVDINGAYVNGHLYYPTETHVIRRDEESGMVVERLETIVIRSDRTTHRAVYAPAPAGTPLHKRVLKLTDGTIIEKEPKASVLRTWDYESISQYMEGKGTERPLSAIVEDILSFLQQSIWLPYPEDYIALALTVPVTYLQSVFESVPLLLLNGEAGSGKSQTGSTMAKMCANGLVIGQVSAATAARLIDETRGFVVLDDVEDIASKVGKSGKDIQTSEFVQALKVSYNKHTAVKYWTDVKTMKTERLDFFGVKMLNNTLGADAILGTRMIRIQTRKMPQGMTSNLRDFSPEDMVRLRKLRNELHTWAFQNVAMVEKTYRDVSGVKTDRHDEIAAPLRTMAKIVGNPEIASHLEVCLSRQHLQKHSLDDDPIETLKEAVRNLIKHGFDTVTLTHLRLEMRALLDANYGMSSTTEIPEWDRPEWLGRQLRSNDLVSDVDLGRKRVYGKNLRMVRFSDWVIKAATHDEAGNSLYPRPERRPEDFCQGCQGCPYRTAGCELQELRQREESRARPH